MGIILTIGIVLIISSFALPRYLVSIIYAFLALTCSFNALTSIHDLLKSNGSDFIIGDQTVKGGTDAHTVAEYLLLPYWFWAVLWLLFSFLTTTLGFVYAFDKHSKFCGNQWLQNLIEDE